MKRRRQSGCLPGRGTPCGVARLCLPLVLLALPVMTSANPGDPDWIPGLYDAADCDDLASAAGSQEGMIAPPIVRAASPPVVAEKADQPDWPEVTVTALPSAEPRAPPVRRAPRSARGSWWR